MTPKQILQAASHETFGDEEFGRYRLELDPGFSEEELEIRELGLRAPPIPDEIRELLLFSRGFRLDQMSFAFWGFPSNLNDIFPCGSMIGEEFEGAYSSWTVDVNQRTGEWGPVFSTPYTHTEIVLVAQTIGDFLQQIIETHRLRRDYTPWVGASRQTPSLQTRKTALASRDPVILAFAKELTAWGPEWRIADLRDRRPGCGFSWMEFGHGTIVHRYGSELLFAVSPSLKPRYEGFLHWLFGLRRTPCGLELGGDCAVDR